MGIYLRKIDGSKKKLVVTLDQLLAINPKKGGMQAAELRYRLGGQVSHNQKRILLYLVTHRGTLVRDYYTCNMDGSKLEFHGPLGTHVMWHPNGRDILTYVNPWATILGDLREYSRGVTEKFGLLGCYNTKTKRMKILSKHKIFGGCHVSPSPDGSKVVLDSILNRKGLIRILLFDYKTHKMSTLCTQKWDTRVEKVDRSKFFKHYNVNPHPVFAHDNKRILFNSCGNGVVRLSEIALT